jgi:hypothetical protein
MVLLHAQNSLIDQSVANAEGDNAENCGFKCSYCFGLRHMEEHCWKKIGN